MRILNNFEGAAPTPPETAPAPPPAAPASPPAADLSRLEALEQIVKSALQRIQGLAERIEALEAKPKAAPSQAPGITLPVKPSLPEEAPAPAVPGLSVNTEALRKGLLSKMWKYLKDAA